MMDTILNLGLNDGDRGGPRRGIRRPGVRPRLPRAVPGDVPLGRRRGRCPTTRGSSCAARSRRCSGPGRAIGRPPTGGSRGSRTTSGPASRSRRWCSATSVRTAAPACCSRATRRPARTSRTATCCSTPRARTSSQARTRPSRSRCSTRACRTSPRSCGATPTILERHYRDCCDIEFTIERGRLWLLQVRVGKRTPQAAVRMALDMAEDPAFPLTREEAVARVAPVLADPPTAVTERGTVGEPLTRGLGVSPGLVSGEVRVTAAGADRGSGDGRRRAPRPRPRPRPTTWPGWSGRPGS